jgi:hypothetical protein
MERQKVTTMTDKHQHAEYSLVEWAENAELKPRQARRGKDAAAEGRALLKASGVDVEQVERNGVAGSGA